MSSKPISVIIKEHCKEFKKINKKHLLAAILIFLMGWEVNFLSSRYLFRKELTSGKFPVLDDFLFQHLPFLPQLSFFYDIFALSSIVLLISWIIIYKKYKKVPFIIFLFGVSYLIRSFFIVLTPLGHPRGTPTNGIFHAFSKYETGVYPSGHTGSSFLCILFTKGIFKVLSIVTFLLTIVFLLIARGHYSIDVFSAILFNYASYSFFKEFLDDWER